MHPPSLRMLWLVPGPGWGLLPFILLAGLGIGLALWVALPLFFAGVVVSNW